MHRRLLATLCLHALVASACGADYLLPNIKLAVDASGRAAPVRVDFDVSEDVTVAFNAFFPDSFSVHPGDVVEVRLDDTGTPHTFTMGRLVDEAVEIIPVGGAPAEELEATAQFQRLPHPFVYDEGPRVRLDPQAAAPCYLHQPPSVQRACRREAPPFDGTQAFHSSGLLAEGEVYELELAADTPPGTYAFMCLVHRGTMTGALEVVAEDEDIAPMREVRDEGAGQVDTAAAAVEQHVTPPDEEATVTLGARPASGRAFVADFLPTELRVDVGRPVTWRIEGLHSVSFKPTGDVDDPWRGTGADIELNEAAWLPSEGVVWPEPLLAFPPPAAEVTIDGGTWDGDGFHSSGIVRADAPLVVTYTLAFSTPGTYEMRCLVHDEARGKVVVGDA